MSVPPEEPIDIGRTRRDQILAEIVAETRAALTSSDSTAYAAVIQKLRTWLGSTLESPAAKELSEGEEETIATLQTASQKLAAQLEHLAPRLRIPIAGLIATLNRAILEIESDGSYIPSSY